MPQLNEELVNVNALGGDEADVQRRLQPAAGENGAFEEPFGGAVWYWHAGVLAGDSLSSRKAPSKSGYGLSKSSLPICRSRDRSIQGLVFVDHCTVTEAALGVPAHLSPIEL